MSVAEKAENINEPMALVGKQDWLFLCNDSNKCIDQYRGTYEIPRMLPRFWEEALNRRQEYFDKLGIPYLFYIIPGKEYIYPEFLPDSVTRSPSPVLWEQMYATVQEKTGVKIQSLHTHLQKEREDIIEPLYYRTDSHWNAFGALAAAEYILRDIAKLLGDEYKPIPRDQFNLKYATFEDPDLVNKVYATMSNGEFLSDASFAKVPDELRVVLMAPQSHKPQRQEPTEFLRSVTKREPVLTYNPERKLKAMFYRDSFAVEMPQLLYGYFNSSTALWMPDISREAVESEKPDIVIQMMVDRFMSRAPRD